MKRWHMLESLISRYFPWYFESNPMTDEEIEIVKTLTKRYAPSYETKIQEFAKRFDFRSQVIRNQLTGFETHFDRRKLESVRSQINDMDRRMRDLESTFSNYYQQMDDLRTQECGLVDKITHGGGAESSELLDYFGLEKTEKAVAFCVVTRSTWRGVKGAMQRELNIDVPGTGIAFIIPLSSIGGKKPLAFLTDGQDFEAGEESALKGTKYELLVVIANQGYTELIMDAAREQQAGGGTVLHAKGTGMEKAEKFLGFSLVNEKEMVFIVVKTATKNRIMRAIMDKAGLSTKAQSIVFSLPVTGTAGMRLLELAGDETDGD